MDKQLYQHVFMHMQQPMWLLDSQQHVIDCNNQAQAIQINYLFSLKKIIQVAQREGCALHAAKPACLDCPVGDSWSADCFPIVLEQSDGSYQQFEGSLCQLDSAHWLLTFALSGENGSTENLLSHKLLVDYVNQAQENERRYLAKELHDGLAQSVYSLMLEVRSLKWLAGTEQPQMLERIDGHFIDVLDEIRQLASELRPSLLDDLGLVPALRELAQRTEEMTGFTINYKVDGNEKRLSEVRETTIFRIIQESVSNALKYSGVNHLHVHVTYAAAGVEVVIHDSGKGFDRKQVETGWGLTNMEERASSVGGSLSIQTAPNTGTTIRLSIPYREGRL